MSDDTLRILLEERSVQATVVGQNIEVGGGPPGPQGVPGSFWPFDQDNWDPKSDTASYPNIGDPGTMLAVMVRFGRHNQ